MHRRHLALAVSAGAALSFAIADRAWAQPLDVEIARLLDNDCAALFPENGGGSTSPDGPNLSAVCASDSPIAVSSSGGGGASPQASNTSVESQRALERAEEEREGGGQANVVPLDLAGLSLWTTADFTREDREITTFEEGYESDNWSSVTGVDYRFNDALFAGMAFQYQNFDAEYDTAGGFDTDSYGGILYGSLTPFQQLFIDAAIGYASKEYEVDRFATFTEFKAGDPTILSGIASSDTDGEELNARGAVGWDFAFEALSISPRAGVAFVHTAIDGYTEKGSSGLELIFDDRSRQSLQSELGINASMSASTGFGVIVPEADFEYIHEFQDDQRHISASFVEDLRASRAVFSFENQRPDRDFFRGAFGAVLVLPGGIQVFARYHTLLGHSYFDTQGVSAGVRIELGGPSVQ